MLRDNALSAYANDTNCLLPAVFRLCSLQERRLLQSVPLADWLTTNECRQVQAGVTGNAYHTPSFVQHVMAITLLFVRMLTLQ